MIWLKLKYSKIANHKHLILICPEYFYLIRTEKSPRKKFINLNNIITSINRLLFFNSGATKIGVDDQIPILAYCFIKAKPKRIFTDCKFMELYIGNKKNKGEDNQLTQLRTVCDFIKQINDVINSIFSFYFNIYFI